MAKKTKARKAVVKKMAVAPKQSNNFFTQIRLGESYASLFLGAVVVIVVLILLFSFLKARSLNRGQIGTPLSTTAREQVINGKVAPRVYVVKEGDDLWHIAERIYGSGYNWVDLANANKLDNPGVLFVDTRLNVPNVRQRTVTTEANQATEQNPITGVSYTIEKGDYLWSIAVRAYGDGFKWVEIAKANNLSNPDIINVGNSLKIPR